MDYCFWTVGDTLTMSSTGSDQRAYQMTMSKDDSRYEVEPRQFEGRLLHQLPAIKTVFGEAYAEVYLADPTDAARVALARLGTRVIEDLGTLPGLDHAPWTSRYLQGLIDTPFLNLTPGTRSWT